MLAPSFLQVHTNIHSHSHVSLQKVGVEETSTTCLHPLPIITSTLVHISLRIMHVGTAYVQCYVCHIQAFIIKHGIYMHGGWKSIHGYR